MGNYAQVKCKREQQAQKIKFLIVLFFCHTFVGSILGHLADLFDRSLISLFKKVLLTLCTARLLKWSFEDRLAYFTECNEHRL